MTLQTDNSTLYALARVSRQTVLHWLEDLPQEVFARELPEVAYGSLRGIYEHVANCYGHWVSEIGLHEPWKELKVQTVSDLRSAFQQVDAVVAEFLATEGDWSAPVPHTFPDGSQETLTKNWLIWHPITHEFHHKGQAVAVGRWLGYPHPGHPDTDLPTPEVLNF